MNRGGRPNDVVWEHFYKIEIDGKYVAKCKYCGNVRATRVERMKNHLSQCVEKNKKRTYISEEEEGAVLSKTESSEEAKIKKGKLDSFVVKTNNTTAHKLDLLIAKFFFANNIPFSVVEHQTFKNLIAELRPGYCPPSRMALGGPLLDEVAAEVEDIAKSNLAGKNVTLVEDGWSNVHNDPVIASCLHISGGKTVFLDAIDSKTNVKNAEYHQYIIENAIEKAKTKFGCEVKAIVTDNAKVMEKTRKLIQHKESIENLIVYGCTSHWMNLLGQELTPDAIIKQVIKVQKYFRNHHLPAAWLKEYPESVKPQIPGDTRWNSQIVCIETFLKNRELYQKIAEIHESEIENDIVSRINNYNLYKQCKDLLVQLKPIGVGLDILQRDTATLADACSTWLGLMKEVSLQPYSNTIEKRMVQALEPFHFLAYLIHPKYHGEGLTTPQVESAHVWAMKKCPECLPIAFEAQELPFPPSYFSDFAKLSNPVTWWKGIANCEGFKNNIHASEFVNMAILLLSCPPSSASIERVFSNFGHIHSKLRNRLGIDKCSKLLMCYRMLRGNFDPDY